jgi:hypothetical protein
MTRKDFILSVIASLLAAIVYDLGRKFYPRLLNIPIKSVSANFFKRTKAEIYHLMGSGSFVIALLYDAYIRMPVNKPLLIVKNGILTSQQFLKDTVSLLILKVTHTKSKSEVDASLKLTDWVKEVGDRRLLLRPVAWLMIMTSLVIGIFVNPLIRYEIFQPKSSTYYVEMKTHSSSEGISGASTKVESSMTIKTNLPVEYSVSSAESSTRNDIQRPCLLRKEKKEEAGMFVICPTSEVR